MAYYNVCPKCGSNLDPGERCDCEREAVKRNDFFQKNTAVTANTGQIRFAFDGKEVGYAKKIVS